MTGRVIETCKLEAGIESRLLASLSRQSVGVAALEVAADRCPSSRIIDGDETPGLTEADGRGPRRNLKKARDGPRRQRLPPEFADIAPPHQQVAQARTKIGIEDWAHGL